MKNNFTALAVAVLGARDPDVMCFLQRWVRPGFVAIDIGANVGTYTVPLSRLVGPAGRVVSFEPNRQTFACLRQNIRQNRLTNVTLVRSAVGEHTGHAALVTDLDNMGEVHLAPPGVGSATAVVLTTIDAEVARLRLPHVDFIKIDIEGYELTALRGAAQTLAANPRLVVQTEIVPVHALRYGNSTAALLAYMHGHGFVPHICDVAGHMHPIRSGEPKNEADWFWARSAHVFETHA